MRQIGTNESTKYELIAEKAGKKILVAYVARKSRAGALDALGVKVDGETRVELLARATATDPMKWRTKAGVIAQCDGWTVKFSNRTQRDVRSTGELEKSIYPS